MQSASSEQLPGRIQDRRELQWTGKTWQFKAASIRVPDGWWTGWSTHLHPRINEHFWPLNIRSVFGSGNTQLAHFPCIHFCLQISNSDTRFVPFSPQQTNMNMMASLNTRWVLAESLIGPDLLNTLTLIGSCRPLTSSWRTTPSSSNTAWEQQQRRGLRGQLPGVSQPPEQPQQSVRGTTSSRELWAWTHRSWRTRWWTQWWWQWGPCWRWAGPTWPWPFRKLPRPTLYHSHSEGRRKRNKWEEKLVQIKRCKNKYRLSVLIVRSSWSMKINSIYPKGNQILYKNVQKNYYTMDNGGNIYIHINKVEGRKQDRWNFCHKNINIFLHFRSCRDLLLLVGLSSGCLWLSHTDSLEFIYSEEKLICRNKSFKVWKNP